MLSSSAGSGELDPTIYESVIGFRVASTPEPSSLVLLALGALGLFGVARRRKS
jgi:hypothetical protein